MTEIVTSFEFELLRALEAYKQTAERYTWAFRKLVLMSKGKVPLEPGYDRAVLWKMEKMYEQMHLILMFGMLEGFENRPPAEQKEIDGRLYSDFQLKLRQPRKGEIKKIINTLNWLFADAEPPPHPGGGGGGSRVRQAA